MHLPATFRACESRRMAVRLSDAPVVPAPTGPVPGPSLAVADHLESQPDTCFATGTSGHSEGQQRSEVCLKSSHLRYEQHGLQGSVVDIECEL